MAALALPGAGDMTTTSLGYSLEPPADAPHPRCSTEDERPENVWYQCADERWATYRCAPFRAGESRNWCADCGRMAPKVRDCTCHFIAVGW